jgi:hypothetical protein
MRHIYDQSGRPRFYFPDRAVYEHGSGRLVHADPPEVPHGPNGGLPAHWIDGGLLHPDLAGQQFYYDADDEPPPPPEVHGPKEWAHRDRAPGPDR